MENFLALLATDSSPIRIQPKLPAGLARKACTLAMSPAEDHWYVPGPMTDVEALGARAKSPPGLVHSEELNERWSQVASPAAAAVPDP